MFNQSLPRVFVTQNIVPKQELILDTAPAKHLVQVLRLKPPARFVLFNGQGGEYTASIVATTKSQTRIFIESFSNTSVESPLKIELWQGISRGEKMDFTIQKAVELGVFSVTPLFTEYCNVKIERERLANKIKHWQGVAIAAAEQSGRCLVPQIAVPLNFRDAVIAKDTNVNNNAETKIILAPKQPVALKNIATNNVIANKKIILIVGPEGGFSAAEIALAEQNNCFVAHLGPRILRTETAALAAISVLQSVAGDLG